MVGNGSDDLLTMLLRSVADGRPAGSLSGHQRIRCIARLPVYRVPPAVEVMFDDAYTLPVAKRSSTTRPP